MAAAMKVQSGKMGTKSAQKVIQRSIHEEIDNDSDEDMSAASENSEADDESSVEGNDVEASGEDSSGDEEEEGEEGSVEDGEDDNASAEDEDVEEEEEEDQDDDGSDEDEDEEMENQSDDGDLGAGDWMEMGDDESDPNVSSSDDEASPQGQASNTDSNDPKLHGNAGWADAMAKILRTSKPKGKKSIVLAKAKKLSQVTTSVKPDEENKNYGFEIDGEEKDVKRKLDETDEKPDLEDIKPKIKKRDLLAEGRTKPDILSRDREKTLSKIATKGVVQLFNAVREQQKDINKKMKLAKGSIRKEDNVLKSVDRVAFLDSLMGNAKSVRVEAPVEIKDEEDVKPGNAATWNVLRDNFLSGSSMKDWDKCPEIKLEDDMDD